MSHEGQTQYLEQIMALLMHGIEIGAKGAEVLRALKRAKASGDFLLHLKHTDGTLAEIVGKRYAQIGRETQHLCGVLAACHARTVAGETVSPYSWVMSCALRPSGNSCPSVRCTASARTFGAVLHNFSHAFGKLALLQLHTGAAAIAACDVR